MLGNYDRLKLPNTALSNLKINCKPFWCIKICYIKLHKGVTLVYRCDSVCSYWWFYQTPPLFFLLLQNQNCVLYNFENKFPHRSSPREGWIEAVLIFPDSFLSAWAVRWQNNGMISKVFLLWFESTLEYFSFRHVVDIWKTLLIRWKLDEE